MCNGLLLVGFGAVLYFGILYVHSVAIMVCFSLLQVGPETVMSHFGILQVDPGAVQPCFWLFPFDSLAVLLVLGTFQWSSGSNNGSWTCLSGIEKVLLWSLLLSLGYWAVLRVF